MFCSSLLLKKSTVSIQVTCYAYQKRANSHSQLTSVLMSFFSELIVFITGFKWLRDWIFTPVVWRFHPSHMCMARLLLGNSIKHGLFYLQHIWGLSITSVCSSCSLYHCYHVYSILLKWLLCNINVQRFLISIRVWLPEVRVFCLIVQLYLALI